MLERAARAELRVPGTVVSHFFQPAAPRWVRPPSTDRVARGPAGGVGASANAGYDAAARFARRGTRRIVPGEPS
ncbi:MAG TPA: hypothetical protein VFU81_04530, partial [Thermomicrobiales bacterium]|nr:hypothetical protein [Thermomicrobiales bacterium]